jgi:hypothetical protein
MIGGAILEQYSTGKPNLDFLLDLDSDPWKIVLVSVWRRCYTFMLIFETVQSNLQSGSILRAARTSEIDVSDLRISAKVFFIYLLTTCSITE